MKGEVVKPPFRHYNTNLSQQMKEHYTTQRQKRTEFKIILGEIYTKAAKQVDARDQFQRSNKIIKDRVPQHVRGKGFSLPAVWYPKQKETDIRKSHRIAKQFVDINGDAPYDHVHNVNETWDPVTRERMLDGLSHNCEGAYQYLDVRKRILPEKKYNNPVLSSWEYGWHVTPMMRKFPVSKWGRGKIMRQSFYRNRGVTNPSEESEGLCMAMQSINFHVPHLKISLLAHSSTKPVV